MHTHYTLEEASNPPKDKWTYSIDHNCFTIHKGQQPPFIEVRTVEAAKLICEVFNHRDELDYKLGCLLDHVTGSQLSYTHYAWEQMRDCASQYMLRYETPTEEERAKEMGEFAAWCSMNKWVFFPIENEWKKIFMLRTFWKTQDELFALFTQEREKQKQQKGENNNG